MAGETIAARLTSQRSNVLIAALLGTEVKGLAPHLFLDRSGGGDVGSTDRVFLQFASERDLVGGTRRSARRRRTGLHRLRDSFEDNPDDALQHGNHHNREKKIEDGAKHFAIYILSEGAAILLCWPLCGPRRCGPGHGGRR